MTLLFKFKTEQIFENKTYDRDKKPNYINEKTVLYDFTSVESEFKKSELTTKQSTTPTTSTTTTATSTTSESILNPGTHIPKFNYPSSTQSTIEYITTSSKLNNNNNNEIKQNQQQSENYNPYNPTIDPFKWLSFTSGHQNNFGVPLEEDERVLAFLDSLNKNVS